MILIRKQPIRIRTFIGLLLGVFLMFSCQAQSTEIIQLSPIPTEDIPSHTAAAIKFPAAQQQIHFEHFMVDEGLSMNTVHAILQDRKGYIWIATEDGLNRYDGYSFKIYRSNSSDPESLSVSNIQSLFEDQDGYIWLGAYEGGLFRYDPRRGTFQQHSPNIDTPNLKSLIIYTIDQDQAGHIWFATNTGLFMFDHATGQWSHFLADTDDPTSLASNEIFTLLIDTSDRLWLGTVNGLDLFDPNTRQFVHFRHNPENPESLSANVVNVITEDNSGNLWIGTDTGGLNRFDPSRQTFNNWTSDPDDPTSLSDNFVTSIVVDAAGLLWVGTRVGLNSFDPQSKKFTRYLTSLNDPDSLSNDWIQFLYLDKTGGLWIGTAYGGVNYFHPLAGQFRHYLPAPGAADQIGDNSVWSLYQDADEILWLGTNGGGLKKCFMEPFTCQEYRHDEDNPESLGNDVVVAIYPDPNGDLWLGTWGGGLNRFAPDTGIFSHYRTVEGDSNSMSSDVVWLIFRDSHNIFWIGTMDGLNAFNPQTGIFTQYHHDPTDPHSISNDQIVALFEDTTGQLWIGTQDGLNRFDRESDQFSRIYHDPDDPESLSHNTVFAIHQDPQERLWFGTYGGGLNLYEPASKTFKHYRVADGLINDSIYGILADQDGNFWMSTNNGISKFDPATELFTNFGEADGLQAREFNFNAYFQNENGEMFFGGVGGVTAFYPEDIYDNPYPPEVVLQTISQGGLPLELEDAFEYVTDLTLRWPNNYFDFEFAAINYYQSEFNEHAYLLENFEEQWNDIGSRRFGRYTNLPGGTYTLRIKGSNNDGKWNEIGKAITIRVIPPLWQNRWFLGIGALIGLVLLISGYRYRVHNLNIQAAELEQQIDARTIEIETQRQQIEALYKADEDLYRHLNLDQVLQTLVDTAVEILKADKGSLVCWDEDKEYLMIRASHKFHPTTVANTRIPRGAGIVGQVAATGEPIIVEDADLDPRVTRSITEVEGIRALIQVPIKTGEEIFGVFSADYAQPRTFSEDEKRLLMSLAQRAAIAIQNAQIYEQAGELAASQERNRLARELHDAVTQTLFSASLIAEALPALWERDPEKGRLRLAKLRQMSRGALAEMRALLLELRPAALLETRLEDLLKQLGEAIMGRENLNVNIKVEGSCKLPPDVHIALYRIAQEALNNIVKHAQAKNVDIELKYLCREDGQLAGIELALTDDGRGFQPQDVAPERLGLGIMRERADSFGAHLEINSLLEKGTQVLVRWSTEK